MLPVHLPLVITYTSALYIAGLCTCDGCPRLSKLHTPNSLCTLTSIILFCGFCWRIKFTCYLPRYVIFVGTDVSLPINIVFGILFLFMVLT